MPKKGATSIQERLWELRKDKGLNLEELSKLTGISKSALGKFAEQTVVDPTAFQKCNHFIVQMQLRQWRVDLLPVLCPAQQIIDGNPIEVCQRDKIAESVI